MWHGRQSALDAPHHGPFAVADIRHHRVVGLQQRRRLDDTGTATPFAGAGAVLLDLKFVRAGRVHPLIAFGRLRHQSGTETGRGNIAAVFTVTPAPATGQPFVEHVNRFVRFAQVIPAGQQVFKIKRTRDGAIRHDLRPHFENSIHDFFERHQEPGHGDGPLGADDAVLGGPYVHHTVKAAVERKIGKEGFHTCDHSRKGRAMCGVVD